MTETGDKQIEKIIDALLGTNDEMLHDWHELKVEDPALIRLRTILRKEASPAAAQRKLIALAENASLFGLLPRDNLRDVAAKVFAIVAQPQAPQ